MEENKLNIPALIIFFIIAVLLLYADYKYIFPNSAIGNPLCKQLDNQGYYETEWDTSGHISCRIDTNSSKWSSYETNKSCMIERYKIDASNLNEYGMHCVWGGAGYWLFVLCFIIPFFIFGIAIATIYELILLLRSRSVTTQCFNKHL